MCIRDRFAFGRFVYQLYLYGHDLSPEAPVKIKPFTPVILGTKDVANFTTHSFPQLGSIMAVSYTHLARHRASKGR